MKLFGIDFGLFFILKLFAYPFYSLCPVLNNFLMVLIESQNQFTKKNKIRNLKQLDPNEYEYIWSIYCRSVTNYRSSKCFRLALSKRATKNRAKIIIQFVLHTEMLIESEFRIQPERPVIQP